MIIIHKKLIKSKDCPDCGAINSMKILLDKYYCPFCIHDKTDKDSKIIQIYLKDLEIKEKQRLEEEAKEKEKKRKEKEILIKKKKEEFERNIKLLENLKKKLFITNKFKELDNVEDTYYLFNYHPTKIWKNSERIDNPLSNDITKLILNIKNIDEYSISLMKRLLKENLDSLNLFTICIIPPHKPGKKSGIKEIAKFLCKFGAIDGTDCLIRKEETLPRHKGNRLNYISEEEIEILKKSLEIKQKELIEGKNILLFDDISTIGTTLESARQLLIENGAKNVISIVLGKTSYDHII